MAYPLAFTISLGAGRAGLSLRAQLIDTAGASVGSLVSTGFNEIGQGCYLWLGAIPEGHRGAVVFSSAAGEVQAVCSINPEEAEGASDLTILTLLGDIKQRTDLIGRGAIVVAPVASNGNVTIIRGDDYQDADGRALAWTATADGWPILTAAAIEFRATHHGGDLVKAGSVVTDTGGAKEVRVELDAADTADIAPGRYTFQLVATLASGNVCTLVTGQMTILENIVIA